MKPHIRREMRALRRWSASLRQTTGSIKPLPYKRRRYFMREIFYVVAITHPEILQRPAPAPARVPRRATLKTWTVLHKTGLPLEIIETTKSLNACKKIRAIQGYYAHQKQGTLSRIKSIQV